MSGHAFVTGGAGFLGRRLVRCLLGQGLSVRCLVRERPDINVLTNGLPEEAIGRLQFVVGDVGDRALLQKELQPGDLVYHLAASLTGSLAEMQAMTVEPTQVLLEEAAKAGVERFVLVSSLGIYGVSAQQPPQILDENVPVDPHPELRDSYTFTKIQQERLAWKIRDETGLPLVVIRPGVLYGPGRPLLSSRVGLALGPVFLRMGGNRSLPYTYVENCAKAVALAGLVPGIEGEIFNVVDDQLPTGKEILEILKQSGKRVRPIGIPQSAIQPLSTLFEWCTGSGRRRTGIITRYKSAAIWSPVRYTNEKAKQKLSWSPEITTEEALRITVSSVS